ncbi:hypothetical protein ACJZ2D_008586 [Fusarium nematophilum]
MERSSKLPSLAPAPRKSPHSSAEPSPSPPATAAASSRRRGGGPSGRAPRKPSTSHACVQCRKTKTKCDGKQPCARCQLTCSSCVYDTRVLSGERLNRLTHAYNRQKDRLRQLEAMLAAMRTGTDAEAAEVMAWIRIGESVESIASYLESRSKAVVVSQSLLAAERKSKSDFIEILFDRSEWLDGSSSESEPITIDLGSRTQSYLASNFGNLPFSSGIRANHYPSEAQAGQLKNYYAQHSWAMMTANDGHGVASVTKAWADTLKKAREMIAGGVPPEELTGEFPAVTALFDKEVYESASMISKWAVRFIYSARQTGYSFTSMAAVWVVWVIMRWMINPTPETYAALPDWIRPTELQVFVPHIDMVDCITWPYFRDYVIQHPEMQHGDLQWLAACCSGVRVSWAGTIEDALCVDEATGQRRLTPEAEEVIRDMRCWSLAASYRAFLPGIDGNIPIRLATDSVQDEEEEEEEEEEEI